MAGRRAKGIFCLEGAWVRNLRDRQSVRHMLELLSTSEGPKHIYRDCATTEELEFYLSNWAKKRYRDHPILFLAFHGKPQVIQLANKEISLDHLANLLEGKCAGRIIHFGACGMLACNRRHITRFLKRTGAVAVCGFRREIDWLRGTAFDLLMFDVLQDYEISLRGIPAFYNELRRSYSKLCSEMGFRLEYLNHH